MHAVYGTKVGDTFKRSSCHGTLLIGLEQRSELVVVINGISVLEKRELALKKKSLNLELAENEGGKLFARKEERQIQIGERYKKKY